LDKPEEQEPYTHIHHKFPYTSSFDLGYKIMSNLALYLWHLKQRVGQLIGTFTEFTFGTAMRISNEGKETVINIYFW